MKSSLRKLLSFLLALIMCISLLPVSAFAEEIEEQAGEEEPAAANPVVGPGETGGGV